MKIEFDNYTLQPRKFHYSFSSVLLFTSKFTLLYVL
jgi:hypothetical protein